MIFAFCEVHVKRGENDRPGATVVQTCYGRAVRCLPIAAFWAYILAKHRVTGELLLRAGVTMLHFVENFPPY